MAHVGSFSHFAFVIVFVFVFVIVILRESVDKACHELLEHVWLYGSVKHIKSCTVDPDFWRGRAGGRTEVFQEVLADLKRVVKRSHGEPGVTQSWTGVIPRVQVIVWSSMAPLVSQDEF